jgi:hypothetical protein
MEILYTLLASEQLAIRWKDGRDAHQVLGSYARITQRQLKRRETLTVFSHPLGEENPFRNHVFAQFACPPAKEFEYRECTI